MCRVNGQPSIVHHYRGRVYSGYLSVSEERAGAESAALFRARWPHLRHAVRKLLPEDRNSRIVDLGAGYGGFVRAAKAAGYHRIEGYDWALEQVEAARHLGEDVKQADLFEALEGLEDEAWDVVVTFDVVEHLKRDEVFKCADGVRRILRPGGRWLIHTANAESPLFGRVRYGDLTHETAFTRRSLQQLLIATGFSTYTFIEDGPVLHGVVSCVRWLLWQAVRSAIVARVGLETGILDWSSILSQNIFAVAVK
jgi:2-polyprenyl-3-methyl-5-hydroxy-6-metoxy-1,4-benzoquinol methylase